MCTHQSEEVLNSRQEREGTATEWKEADYLKVRLLRSLGVPRVCVKGVGITVKLETPTSAEELGGPGEVWKGEAAVKVVKAYEGRC